MIWMLLAIGVPFLASLLGTEAVRRYAIRTSMVDVPNERSSHKIPTPRGGGIAMTATIVAGLCVLLFCFPNQRLALLGILGGGLMVAIVGMLDDRFDLSAKSRLAVQLVAACCLIGCLRGTGNLELVGIPLGWFSIPVAILFVAWSTNVFNFMDGLDGFAGGQGVIAASAAALIAWQGADSALQFTMLITAGATAGFLYWNWAPAKIFMGDCGSGFLGFLFAAFALTAHKTGTATFTAGVALLAVFYLDATLTLFRRMIQKENWTKPHRSHAYQLATQMGASHKQVTLVSLVMFLIAALLGYQLATSGQPTMSFRNSLHIVVFAAFVTLIWSTINWLFIGRTQALTTINNVDGNSHTPVGPVGSAGVTYLRFRHLQTKFRSWRSVVPHNDLLAEATGAASRLGYTVSHDWLEGVGGGSCEAVGEKWILLDFNMAKRDQIRQILLAIVDEADKLDGISADLQTAIRETRSTSLRKAA